MKKIIILAKFLLALVWAVFIFVLMTAPVVGPESDAKGFTISDKLVHIFLFAVLAWLLASFLSQFKRLSNKLVFVFSFLGTAIWALFCEYLQQFVPLRNSSLYDFAFALLGIILALFVFNVIASDRRERGNLVNLKRLLRHFAPRNDKGKKPKLLLHLCCGPCGAQISRELMANYEVSLFFANSNIDNKEEFKKRLRQAKKVAEVYGLPLTVENYEHDEWRELVRGHEDEPERGSRCLICYRQRLERTGRAAEAGEFAYFASSLAVSPYKDTQAVIHLGREIGAKIKPKFLDRNFGQGNGWQQAVEAAKNLGLYRQKYCGCEFSKRQEK